MLATEEGWACETKLELLVSGCGFRADAKLKLRAATVPVAAGASCSCSWL